MKSALLTVALLLMAAALLSPIWVQPTMKMPAPSPRLQRTLVSGRIKGDFKDRPWAGTVLYFGSESMTLKEDGAFDFSVFPGIHILKVCCSNRFQQIYREIHVEDRDLYFELEASPLLKIPGRLETPQGKPLRYSVNLSASLIDTNVVDRTVVASDGSFAFHLSEGEWRIGVDNPNKEYTVASMTFDGVELRDRKLTISDVKGPSLPLRITLK